MNILKRPGLIFQVINVIVGGLMITGAIGHFIFFSIWHPISSLIIGIYAIIFGLAVIAIELLPSARYHVFVHKYAGFMYGFGGRGAFYMLVGGLVASHEPWIETLLHVCGSLILIVGFSYILFQIARSLGVPTSMTPPRKPNFFEEGSEPLWNADRYEEVPDVEVGSSPEVAGK